MHAPRATGQQGLLPDMHRTAYEAAESAYQSLIQDNVSLLDRAIQGLLQLRADSVAYQAGRRPSDARSTENYPSCEGTLAQALLSSLKDKPRFTEQQEEAERAAMTDEERAAALSDLFGKQCTVDTHTSKRPT